MGFGGFFKGLGNFLLPGDPFGKSGPQIGDYAGDYIPPPEGGYAAANASARGSSTSMGGLPAMGGSYQYSPYTPMSGMGLGYGQGTLGDTMAQYEPSTSMAQSALENNPFGSQQGGGGFFGDMSGAEKVALAAQALGSLGGIYGQYKEGKARDEDRKRAQEDHDRMLRERDEAAKTMSPLVAQYLGKYAKGG